MFVLRSTTGTLVVLHCVLQSDGCTNGVLTASDPVDVAVMGSSVLRDMISFSHSQLRSCMGRLLIISRDMCLI